MGAVDGFIAANPVTLGLVVFENYGCIYLIIVLHTHTYIHTHTHTLRPNEKKNFRKWILHVMKRRLPKFELDPTKKTLVSRLYYFHHFMNDESKNDDVIGFDIFQGIYKHTNHYFICTLYIKTCVRNKFNEEL